MAGQFQVEDEGLGQAFFEGEFDDFEGIALHGLEGKAQVALAGHGQTPSQGGLIDHPAGVAVFQSTVVVGDITNPSNRLPFDGHRR
ncbi:hypothetical protein D3C76_1132720 [compost metagenome]